MKDKEGYSFCTGITEEGCIHIPEEILKELDFGQQMQVCIIPDKAKNKIKTIMTDNSDMSFSILRNKNQIYKRLKETIAIDEDYGFLLWYYNPRNDKYKHLDIPQLVGVLMKLYGEPDSFYDDYKCSFNYTFDFKIIYKNEIPVREVNLVMTIYDYKDSLYIQFRRLRENAKDDVLKLIEDVVKRKDLNLCIIILNNYFYGFYEGYGAHKYDKFERYQPYSKMKYGYDGIEFYLIIGDEEEEEEIGDD